MKPLMFACWLLFMSSPVIAQTVIPATPTSVNVYILNAADPLGGASLVPARNTSIGAASANCNQPMPATPPGPLSNPSALAVTDPFNAGKACLVGLPSNLPNGQDRKAVFAYVAPSCVVNGQAVSPCEGSRIAAAPFFHTVPIPGPPVVPGAAGVVRP